MDAPPDRPAPRNGQTAGKAEAKRFFIGMAQKMWYGALAAAQQVWHALEVAWIETTSFLSKTWTNFSASVTESLNSFSASAYRAAALALLPSLR